LKSCFDRPQAYYADEINAIGVNRRKLLQRTGLFLIFCVTGCLDSNQSGNAEAAQTPDPNHQIQIENEISDPATVTVSVLREKTGKTVYNQTYTLQPNETVTAYNTQQANPDGIEEFNVSVTSGGSTDSFTLETDQCMGDVIARVTESDGIDMVYSIC